MVDINITCIFQIKHWSAESNKQSWSIRYVYHSVHVASSSKIPFPPLTQQGSVLINSLLLTSFPCYFTQTYTLFLCSFTFVLFLYRTQRPTDPLAWWGGKKILGGRDGLCGGTWLVGFYQRPILDKYKIFHDPTLEGTSSPAMVLLSYFFSLWEK
jgi:hypothetical protein